MTRRRRNRRTGRGRAVVLMLGLTSITLGAWQLGGGIYIKAKAAVGQIMLEDSWQEALDGASSPKPWSWADVSPTARLEVPSLGIDTIVLSDVSGEAMAWGPGHMPGTPMPGKAGLSVLGGHRDTHFSFLKDLKAGDAVFVTTQDGRRSKFIIEAHQITDADQHGLAFEGDTAKLALVTCWPFDTLTTGGSERYVVTANLAD